ncbi:oxidoreductase [Desulfitobacterium hafniense]|uniref:Oxidoreductase n=1 Tax=Desulfitobacterium hafniense TaxID=49338 RepID=A0A0W1JII5_DESHA|nr:NADH:flavin oxidoreductase [Desulfitobacterium hafniense]KTE91508.1 oxidoreductase [Desulfitobacterium hafniense]
MLPLFEPIRIKDLEIKNRIVMPPMALDIATEQGAITHKLIEHYRMRTRGVGMIIVEHAYVNPEGKAHPRQLGIHRDDLIPALEHLAAEIHKQGAVVGIQISHGGARSMGNICGPSSIQSQYLTRFGEADRKNCRVLPRKLDQEGIKGIIADFARAARRAQKAGFDFVEIHGAHGYLVNQFYSPLTNIRRDEYGGSLERRLTFPLEVVKSVRRAVGRSMPVFYRLGADDRLPGGNTVQDSALAAQALEAAGVDCLDLSGGISGYLRHGEEGFFAYMGQAIKPQVTIPVMVTGGIKTGNKANEMIAGGIADFVGVGRTLLKENEWAYKEWVRMGSGTCPYQAI